MVGTPGKPDTRSASILLRTASESTNDLYCTSVPPKRKTMSNW